MCEFEDEFFANIKIASRPSIAPPPRAPGHGLTDPYLCIIWGPLFLIHVDACKVNVGMTRISKEIASLRALVRIQVIHLDVKTCNYFHAWLELCYACCEDQRHTIYRVHPMSSFSNSHRHSLESSSRKKPSVSTVMRCFLSRDRMKFVVSLIQSSSLFPEVSPRPLGSLARDQARMVGSSLGCDGRGYGV